MVAAGAGGAGGAGWEPLPPRQPIQALAERVRTRPLLQVSLLASSPDCSPVLAASQSDLPSAVANTVSTGAQFNPGNPDGLSPRADNSVAAIAKKVIPSTVTIIERNGNSGGTGSGFVYRATDTSSRTTTSCLGQ